MSTRTRTRTRTRTLALRANAPRYTVALAALVGVSCGGAYSTRGFDIDFPDNRTDDLRGIAATVAARTSEPPTPMVLLTPPPPARGMTAFALPDGRRLWQSGARLDERPVAAGDVVVAHSDGSVMGFDAASGRERWRVGDQQYHFLGAGRDGELLAISLGPGDLNRREGTFMVLDARTGGTVLERHVEHALGAPTVAAGYAFVPWDGQYLSIFDLGRGEERARIRSADDVFSRAVREGNAVYYGARVLYRLAAESGSGRRAGASQFAIPRDDLPGNPAPMPDGYSIAPSGVNARERVAVVTRPDPAQPGARPVDGAVYSLFHRVVFSIAAEGGAVRWAYTHSADIAGAQAVRGGLVLVDERGVAALLDAQGGNVVWRHEMGVQAAQAVIQVPIDFAPARSGEEPVQPPVTTLIAAAGGTDTRLLPARLFAARALTSLPGIEATRGLLDIASRRNYPAALRAAAGEALATRTDGIEVLIEALGAHYDYVRGTSAPPVGYIARAIAAARDRRGVAPLIAHLQDPETPAVELPPLVSALRVLADPAAVSALLDFIRLYHADEGAVPPVGEGAPVNDRSIPEQDAINAALELAVQTILQLGGPEERRWVDAMIDDANTLPVVRTAMARAIAPGAGQSTAQSTTGTGDSATQESGGTPGPVDPNLPPARLSTEMIEEAFAPVRERLLACFRGATGRPPQLRIQFRYDAAGTVSTVTVTPVQWQSCMAPIATEVHLPVSQTAREIGTYYLVGGR